MKQDSTCQKILAILLDHKIIQDKDEDAVWIHLQRVYGAGYDAGYSEGRHHRWKQKPVMQIDKEGRLIKIHLSIKEAALDVSVDRTSIYKALNGELKTVAGTKWKYVDEKSISSEETVGSTQAKPIPPKPGTHVSKIPPSFV